jgi:hypothetical protein
MLTFSIIDYAGRCIKSNFSSEEIAYEYIMDLCDGTYEEDSFDIHPIGTKEEVDQWYEYIN